MKSFFGMVAVAFVASAEHVAPLGSKPVYGLSGDHANAHNIIGVKRVDGKDHVKEITKSKTEGKISFQMKNHDVEDGDN